MHPSGLRYKKINEIKDKLFRVDNIDEYALSIVLGAYDVQVSVLDVAMGRLVFFEDYAFSRSCSPSEQLTLLQQLCESHPFLNAGFWKRVDFTIKNNKFVQVPLALFEEKEALKYLTLNAVVDREKVLYCRSKHYDLVTVFALHTEIANWIEHKYTRSKVGFFHQAAGLIEGVCTASLQQKGTPLYVYVDRFKLHILFTFKGKLIYYNQFVVREFADYIKYIMLVIKMMKMDPATIRIIIWGYIGKRSNHLMAFSKYLRNVSLGSRPGHLKFGHVFDELEDHHFFDLYSMYHLSA